jgi:hypothetical protein
MSAYVTYEGIAVDITTGEQLGTFQFRCVATPIETEVNDYAAEFYGPDAICKEYHRTCVINRYIGRTTPATRRVSARVRIVA